MTVMSAHGPRRPGHGQVRCRAGSDGWAGDNGRMGLCVMGMGGELGSFEIIGGTSLRVGGYHLKIRM